LVCVGKGGTVVHRSCSRHLDRWPHPQGKVAIVFRFEAIGTHIA
jgi:hypothetical protein